MLLSRRCHADRELTAWGAAQVFAQCTAVARDFSLQISSNRVGGPPGPGEEPKELPLINLNKFAYLVDVRGEDQGKATQGKGQVGRTRAAMTEDFSKFVLARWGQMWHGAASDGSKIPSQPEMAEILQVRPHHGSSPRPMHESSGHAVPCLPSLWFSPEPRPTGKLLTALVSQNGSGMVYYGLGRMLSYVSPATIAGLDLSKCNLAIIMDKVTAQQRLLPCRAPLADSVDPAVATTLTLAHAPQANNVPAAERQKYLDNHKTKELRSLESSPAAAALLTLRGARNVITNTSFSTVDTNHEVLVNVLEGLRTGLPLGEVHLQAVQKLNGELHHWKHNAVLYGVPFIQAHTSGKA